MMTKRKVMVIHNEQVVGDMAKVALEQEGYSVARYLNVEPALQRLLGETFDVLITDHKMTCIEGTDLLRTVKNSCPATKIIMISSYASFDTALDAVRPDIHDVFKMPVRLKDLKASIKRAMQMPSEGDERLLAPELEIAAVSS